ncbi:TetR/AcrR family transcriptional regulator [Amycolatopsis minnesotensis]|uniref:HTH tetR-type domain-containing protein n=1 Tax=Amycolatopsis minnesotensis TaxID=337894 RepID=A0ABP5DLX0_9PSEU
MPKHVDHDARRHRIADAVCDLIADRGIEGVTLRDVAARAEVSMGAVQRAFPTGDLMLGFALDHVIAKTQERGARRIDASGSKGSAKTLLTITLQEMALAGAGRRADAAVWLTFAAAAAVREDFAAVLRAHHEKGHELLAWLIGYGQDTGEVRPDLDAADEARAVQTFVDGITQHFALGFVTTESAHRLIDDHLRGWWASRDAETRS